MAKDAFPWSVPENDPPLNSNLEVNDARPSLKDRITKNAKLLAPFGLLFVAFFFIYLFNGRRTASAIENTGAAQLEVLVTMTPLKKNDPLLPELLKVVGCDKRALSKKQVLSLVRQGDVEALRDRLLAKKDIPPNQILFWDDLTFLSRSPRGDTKIYFAKELGHD